MTEFIGCKCVHDMHIDERGITMKQPMDEIRAMSDAETATERQRQLALSMRAIQDGMRAMSDAEIADLQRRLAPLMANNQDAMRGCQMSANVWATEPAHFIPDQPKLTLWQRVKRWFAGNERGETT